MPRARAQVRAASPAAPALRSRARSAGAYRAPWLADTIARMADPTFRDFAMSVMQGNVDQASSTLALLLGLAAPQARTATEHFKARASDPAFLPKAMSLRTVVTSGSDAEIGDLLVECFGLDAASRATAVAAVRSRYPAPAS